ncbi:MAG: YHYH protein, partial [Verrucomicrobiota bacterium]
MRRNGHFGFSLFLAGARAIALAAALLILPGIADRCSAHPGHSDETIHPFTPGLVLLVAAAPADAPRRDNVSPAGSSEVSITVEGNYRLIRANGLPNHPTGQFPNRGNPNRVAPQNYNYKVPVKPQAAPQPTRLGMHPFGIAVNGVVFDPGAAEWWNGDFNWQYEPMSGAINLGVDQNNAHVQPTGAYHYHAMPTDLLNLLTSGKSKVVLVGWAADGFPIYGPWGFANAKDTNSPLKKLKSSYRVRSGTRPDGPGGKYDGTFVADYEYVKGAGDLDECNGRFGITPEFPAGTYHYVLTDDFPFIPRLFKGAPDSSFFRHGPPGGFGGPGGRGPRGPGGFGPPGP